MILAEDLTKHFDEFVAVNGIHLNVPTGQVLVILGPNGAGKTTTVRMLTSVLVPTRGRAEVAGYDVVRQADKVRASVGVLTEHHGLYSRMNAIEYLDFFANLYRLDLSKARKRSLELLDFFGLGNDTKRRMGEYSKGMRQKLALVRALLHEPPVLLLDEPTSAMDPESARTVRDAIRTLRSDHRTIVLCTHNLTEAEELADQVAIIRRGKIVFNDTLAMMKRRLLGPDEYEAVLSEPFGGDLPVLPEGVTLLYRHENSFGFLIDAPDLRNPLLLQRLVESGARLKAFREVPRSLESAYLKAVTQPNSEVSHV